MAQFASTTGHPWAAGHFLVNPEECIRESMMVAADHSQAITRDSRKVVPAGAVIPANDATAKGILYEDIDVTNGDAPGSVVVEGTIYADLLPAEIAVAAVSALTGIKAQATHDVVRPYSTEIE